MNNRFSLPRRKILSWALATAACGIVVAVHSPLQPLVAQAEAADTAPVVLGTPAKPVNILGPLTVNGGLNGPIFRVLNSKDGGGMWAKTIMTMDLPSPYSQVHLCVNGTVMDGGIGGNLLTRCTTSQSSLRYKTDVQPYSGGLSIVNRLTPVHFAWKESGQPEVGLVAEEVAPVEPLLTFKNRNDEIEGIKYEILSVALINAIKEQQQELDGLRQQLRGQQGQLDERARRIHMLHRSER